MISKVDDKKLTSSAMCVLGSRLCVGCGEVVLWRGERDSNCMEKVDATLILMLEREGGGTGGTHQDN